MKLLLIRHGDPDYGSDSLTPLGHEQARLLAETLAGERIDELYASPMGRAQLTARYTAEAKAMPVSTLDWLHELNGNYGPSLWAWNLPASEVFRGGAKFTPDEWPERVVYGPHMAAVAGEFHKQFDAFMASQGYVREGQGYRTTRRDDGRTLAFFCHGGVTLTLLSHLLQIPLPVVYAQFGCDPTNRTTLRFEAADGFGVFRLMGLNDMSHTRRTEA